MITDRKCIELICDAYNTRGNFEQRISVDGVSVFTKDFFNDAYVIIFPGSETFLDWERDFNALMVTDPLIGQVEAGFMTGMRNVFKTVSIPQGKQVIVTGHSLGAARALVFGALGAAMGLLSSDDRVVVFGSPRPGGPKMRQLLAPIPVASYKNRKDPVTDVPFWLPDLPYIHPRQSLRLDVAPPDPDPWGFFADHHSELYLKGTPDECALSPL